MKELVEELSFYVDEFLGAFVRRVAENKFETPPVITLIVNGLLISGNVISYQEWFQLMSPNSDNKIEPVESTNNTEVKAEAEKESDTEEDDFANLRRYIHLKDAVIFHGLTRIPSEGGELIRVKLSSVDAWMEASFEVTKEERQPRSFTINGNEIEIQ